MPKSLLASTLTIVCSSVGAAQTPTPPPVRLEMAIDDFPVAGYLGKLGYRIAPVKADSRDWHWNQIYLSCLSTDQAESAGKIVAAFVEFIVDSVANSRKVAEYIWGAGQQVPQVLVVHATPLTLRSFAKWITALKKPGIQFIDADRAIVEKVLNEGTLYVQ